MLCYIKDSSSERCAIAIYRIDIIPRSGPMHTHMGDPIAGLGGTIYASSSILKSAPKPYLMYFPCISLYNEIQRETGAVR